MVLLWHSTLKRGTPISVSCFTHLVLPSYLPLHTQSQELWLLCLPLQSPLPLKDPHRAGMASRAACPTMSLGSSPCIFGDLCKCDPGTWFKNMPHPRRTGRMRSRGRLLLGVCRWPLARLSVCTQTSSVLSGLLRRLVGRL